MKWKSSYLFGVKRSCFFVNTFKVRCGSISLEIRRCVCCRSVSLLMTGQNCLTKIACGACAIYDRTVSGGHTTRL